MRFTIKLTVATSPNFSLKGWKLLQSKLPGMENLGMFMDNHVI